MIKRTTSVTCDMKGCWSGYSWNTFKEPGFIFGYVNARHWSTGRYGDKETPWYCPLCRDLIERVKNLPEKTQKRLVKYFYKGRPLTNFMGEIHEVFELLEIHEKWPTDNPYKGWFRDKNPREEIFEEFKEEPVKEIKLTKRMKQYEKYFGKVNWRIPE